MSTASVLIAADQSGGPEQITPGPRYTLLLSTDPALIEAAQRLRHDVFTSEPGFSLAGVADGRDADAAPAWVAVPALMRGYLRLGAQVCGDPAHDPDFGVGDFPALLDKRQADIRYLKRLRSVAAAAALADGIAS